MNGNMLCWDIKSHLESDTSLSYNNAVEFQIWEESPFPQFETRCIVVSPEAFQFNNKAFQTMQETFYCSVYCIVKNTDPVESIPQLIYMVYDVWKSLWKFFKNNEQFDVRYDEMAEKINIKSRRTAENKDFYWWVCIPVKVKFKAITFEEINQ